MLKRYAIIFSLLLTFSWQDALALHSFGVITDIEAQSRQGEVPIQSAYQNIFTFEQNWSDASSKAIAQLRIFEYYKKSDTVETFLHEVYPAEVNYDANKGSQRFTIGYQSLYLSEGFNLIDTEVFHAKNSNLSVFSTTEKRYYTSPGISYKMIGEMASIQLAVLKFEKSERLSLLQKESVMKMLPNFKEPTNRVANGSDTDQLAKILGSTSAFDWSVYYSRTYEKAVTIQFNPLKGDFSQVSLPFNSFGAGISGLLGQSVLRLDYQKNIERTYMTAANTQIRPDVENINLSFEQSFSGTIRANIILGSSKLTADVDVPVREKEINDVYLNLTYKFSDKFNMDIASFDRLNAQTSGQSLVFNYKVRENIEIRAGVENFWTGPKSRLAFLDQEDKIYLGARGTVF